MEKKKKTQNRWSKEEFELLKSLMYKDLTCSDLLEYFPNRDKKNIKAKLEKEKMYDGFNRSGLWTKEENELLKKLYPITKNEELPKYFIGKTEGAIYSHANRMGLKKDYVWQSNNILRDKRYWSDSKSRELKDVFSNLGEEETYNYFREKYNHTKNYIKNKLIELKLIYNEMDRYIISNRKNPNLNDVFKVYKDILRGNIESFKPYIKNISKQQLILLFRYYNRTNNVIVTREYFEDKTIGNLLKDAKIKQLVKSRFHSYYDFITFCYPNLNLKPWSMNNLNVRDGFWDKKYNRFWNIREGIKTMIEDKIIDEPYEVLELEYDVIYNYISSSMLCYYKKQCIEEYLQFCGINSSYTIKVYNNIKFDSYQEKQVYKYIYENITDKIQKCFKRDGYLYTNEKYQENYIPDFYIEFGNERLILVEYFGMYRRDNPSSIFKDYCDKTDRKIEYYNSLNDIIFVSLFPKDFNDNFKGVREKLTPFIIK